MRRLIAALALFCTQAFAIDLSGKWHVVEWSDSAPHAESVVMVFDESGRLTTSATVPGKNPEVEVTQYRVLGTELEVIRASGEVGRYPLEQVENGLRVRIPFGYFVLARTPNHSLQARLP